jgi:hypothetical protein
MGAIKNLSIEVEDALLNDDINSVWHLEHTYGEDFVEHLQMSAIAGLYLQQDIPHASTLWRNLIEHFFDADLPWITESVKAAHDAGLDKKQIQSLIDLCAAYYAEKPDVAIARWDKVSLV